MARRLKSKATGSATSEGEYRNVQSVGFNDAQWAAIEAAADIEGLPAGSWVRAAALREARRMGLWKPMNRPGPGKTTGESEN